MAEELIIPTTGTKAEKYELLFEQTKALLRHEKNQIANMANLCAVLKYGFNFFWVGFYLVNENELILGPFQGPVACTRIAKGKGVCGSAWKQNKALIVPNVNEFLGHIACSSASQSEIVLPVYNKSNTIIGVLDVDSEHLNHFDETDQEWLQKMISLLV